MPLLTLLMSSVDILVSPIAIAFSFISSAELYHTPFPNTLCGIAFHGCPPFPRTRSLSMSRRVTRRQALAASAASLGYLYTSPAFSTASAKSAFSDRKP